MDKLRAIQYFNRAAELGSFTAAARSLDVSTPAVTQLIDALERSLGIALFSRTTRRLSLTANGERYYEISRGVETDLQDIEQHLDTGGKRPRGTLTVGMRSGVGRNCVMPSLEGFLLRFPEVELVLKTVETIHEIADKDLDLAVLTGWPPERDIVVRMLAQSRHVVCATPEYWMRAGRPQKPEDLLEHHCLVFRSAGGALLDRWIFEKDGEQRVVNVGSHLISDDRNWVEEAALAGLGVVRFADLIISRHLSAGTLTPVLTDWEALEAPPIYAAYSPRLRRSKLVRVFLDFLLEVFGELERTRTPSPGMPRNERRPEWFGRAHGRQSVFAARALKNRRKR